MTIRIAILAACAGTLIFAQADVARANYGAASESKVAGIKTSDRGFQRVAIVLNLPWAKGDNKRKPGKGKEKAGGVKGDRGYPERGFQKK